MSDEKVLTKEIAEQFLADPYSVDVEEFTTIEDDAAEVLSECDWPLNLYGLIDLSDAAAEFLSKHKGGICLDGLSSLTDVAAESLSKYKREIHLNGLKSLSISAAKSIGQNGQNAQGRMGQELRLNLSLIHI